MYPFQVWNEEHQRIDFYFDRFERFRDELFDQYPVDPNHERIEFDLIFESDRLEDVWVHDWNPHHEVGNYHLSVYDCFYDCDDWSTIFEVYPGPGQHRNINGNITGGLRVFAEKGHGNPWGERIRLMSTSSNPYDDSAHRFVQFRGKFYKVWGGLRRHYPPRTWINDFLDYPYVIFPRNLLTRYARKLGRTPKPKPNWHKEGF